MAELSATKRLVSLRTGGRDLAGLLRELYVDQHRSDREIAEALDVGRMTVLGWRKEFGITRPPRPPVTLDGSAEPVA